MLITVDTRSPSRCYAFDNHSKQLCHANDNAVLPVPELTDMEYMLCGAIRLNDLLNRLEEKWK